jgi:hypothetical protein
MLAIVHTEYFMNDNEPDGIENATHNTFIVACKCIVGYIMSPTEMKLQTHLEI